jgi:hypothetical protein
MMTMMIEHLSTTASCPSWTWARMRCSIAMGRAVSTRRSMPKMAKMAKGLAARRSLSSPNRTTLKRVISISSNSSEGLADSRSVQRPMEIGLGMLTRMGMGMLRGEYLCIPLFLVTETTEVFLRRKIQCGQDAVVDRRYPSRSISLRSCRSKPSTLRKWLGEARARPQPQSQRQLVAISKAIVAPAVGAEAITNHRLQPLRRLQWIPSKSTVDVSVCYPVRQRRPPPQFKPLGPQAGSSMAK